MEINVLLYFDDKIIIMQCNKSVLYMHPNAIKDVVFESIICL